MEVINLEVAGAPRTMGEVAAAAVLEAVPATFKGGAHLRARATAE